MRFNELLLTVLEAEDWIEQRADNRARNYG